MKQFIALGRSLRPHQWIKNLFVFVAVIFANRLNHFQDIEQSIITFILFCGLSGGVYIMNDIFDLAEDQKHPIKRLRPLASGKISKRAALIFALFLITIILTLSWFFQPVIFLILSSYLILNILYSKWLKKVVFIDVIIIALGFVLRAVSGAAAIEVSISPWLFVCTFFLAIFIGLTKRRQELISIDQEQNHTRHALTSYTPQLLDQLITVSITTTLLSYTLYTFNTTHSSWLILTIPLVLYGIFRFLYLVQIKKLGEDPLEMLTKDKALGTTIILWIGMTLGVIYLV